MAARAPRGHPAIVVGTDFSASAENAARRAIALAKASGATLHVLHAQSPLPRALVRKFLGGKDEEVERAALERIVRQARAEGVQAHAHHVRGVPARAVRAKARELSAALIVVGTRGRRVPDAFVGSTAERVAAIMRVPVLLVRRPAGTPYRRVLVATDIDSDIAKAMSTAALVAPGAQLSLVHAYEGGFETTLVLHGAKAADIQSYRRQARREAHDRLSQRVLEAGADPGMLILHHGDPRAVLQREERRARNTLVVIQRGRSEVWHVLFGSVTRAVVEHGTSDVLLV